MKIILKKWKILLILFTFSYSIDSERRKRGVCNCVAKFEEMVCVKKKRKKWTNINENNFKKMKNIIDSVYLLLLHRFRERGERGFVWTKRERNKHQKCEKNNKSNFLFLGLSKDLYGWMPIFLPNSNSLLVTR